MRSAESRTRRGLLRFLAVAAAGGILLLAAGLPGVDFSLPASVTARNAVPTQGLPIAGQILSLFLAGLAAICGVLLTAWVVVPAIRGRRKRKDSPPLYREPVRPDWSIRVFGLLLAAVLALSAWLAWKGFHLIDVGSTASRDRAAPTTAVQPGAAGAPHPGTPAAPDSSSPFLFPVLALLATGGIVALALVLRARNKPSELAPETVADLAADAARDMGRGVPLDDVVLRCYRDMCVLFAGREEFREDMTAREFARRLHSHGLPSRELDVLTRLFEQVRYGHAPAGDRERVSALQALDSIRRTAASISP